MSSPLPAISPAVTAVCVPIRRCSRPTPKFCTQNDDQALVRATLEYATAVGALYDTRDLKVVKEGDSWKVEWPVVKEAKVPPQVIQENYLRWDVITRGSDDDWGAQNVEAPRVRIVSMNAIAHENNTIIVGEIENEDTVPGFVSVGATLIGKDGNVLGEETSFDKISHTLLPKEISPFRIDFPGVRLATVKSVRMQPNSMLVPASADPVIGVMHQRVETDARGRHVLKGDLVNQSGSDRQYSACAGYVLRQCRQSDLGVGWLRGSGAVAANAGAVRRGSAR